jgi:biopolymer transport protein TolQ
MMPLISILQAGSGMRASVVSLVIHSSPFAKVILLGLLVASVYCWAVIWNRLRLYGSIERADRSFLEAFQRLGAGGNVRLLCDQHPQSLLARVAREGHGRLEHGGPPAPPGVTRPLDAQQWELAQRAMERRAAEENEKLESHVGVLATTGSVAPFVGLMGTVWGVMSAFLNIGSQGSASLAVVAPGIAEALIATVAGLAAAIPAVVAYNHCLGRLRGFAHRAEVFISEFLDRRRATAGA